MSLQSLTKNCLLKIFEYLPVLDKKNVAEYIDSPVSMAALNDSTWRCWKTFDLMDKEFLDSPTSITLVLDCIKKIDSVQIHLPKLKSYSLVPFHDIISAIQCSEKLDWQAEKLVIDMPINTSIGMQKSIAELISVVLQRAGSDITDVKFHVNENDRYCTIKDSAVDVFFDAVLSKKQFQKTSTLDLDANGRKVGDNFGDVLNLMPLKSLSISNLTYLPHSALNRCLPNLEFLLVKNCYGFRYEQMMESSPSCGFPSLKEGKFHCNIATGLSCYVFCQKCIKDADYTIEITNPVYGDLDATIEETEEQVKELVRVFINGEKRLSVKANTCHMLLIGSPGNSLFLTDMYILDSWIRDEYNNLHSTVEEQDYWQFKINECSMLRIFYDKNVL